MIDATALLAALADAAERDPGPVARILAAVGAASEPDPWVATKAIARDLGEDDDRFILEAARRGEVEIHGPRGHRVMRRSERDRWLASFRVERSGKREANDEHADERACLADLERKIRRGAAKP